MKKTDDYTEKMAGCRPYPFYCCLVWYDCLFHGSDDRRNTNKRSLHTTYHLCSGGDTGYRAYLVVLPLDTRHRCSAYNPHSLGFDQILLDYAQGGAHASFDRPGDGRAPYLAFICSYCYVRTGSWYGTKCPPGDESAKAVCRYRFSTDCSRADGGDLGLQALGTTPPSLKSVCDATRKLILLFVLL